MKILMVSPNVVVGGAQKIMLYLAKGLQDRGHQVVIYTTMVDHSKLPPWTTTLTYHVEDVPILRPGGELANFTAIDNVAVLAGRLARLRQGILRAIRDYDVDLVNPHNPPANWLCSFLRVPVVWSCHNNPMAFYRNLRDGYVPLFPGKAGLHHRGLEAVYEGLDYLVIRHGIRAIVSSSRKIARGIHQIYGRLAEAIDFAFFDEHGPSGSAVSLAAKFEQMDQQGMTLVQVGQLVEDKKPQMAVDVLDRVRRRIPNARLVFAGDGTLRSSLEAEVKRRGLEGAVSFVGFLDEQALAPLYRSAHVLLFPGSHQPGGIVPVEAIWSLVVPIVTDTSGISEILTRHGLTTITHPTAEAFTEQVLGVYARRREVGSWLSRIRDSLRQELSYERFLDRYEQVFERERSAHVRHRR